jgi:hypothetical protein
VIGYLKMARAIQSYIQSHPGDVVQALNAIAFCYFSPCTDVAFKAVMNDHPSVLGFIKVFCKVFGSSNEPSCRMLDNSKILEGYSIDVDSDEDIDNITIDRISESIGNVGSFSILKKASKRKGNQTNK